MGGVVDKVVDVASDVVGSVTEFLGLTPEVPEVGEIALPEKTEAQKQLEAEQAEAARQTSLKTEREKQARARGATGRRSLTYTPTAQSVGVASSKLGGGS